MVEIYILHLYNKEGLDLGEIARGYSLKELLNNLFIAGEDLNNGDTLKLSIYSDYL